MANGKIEQNSSYIRDAAKVREHVFVGEVPHPSCIRRCPELLIVTGNIAYIKQDVIQEARK